MREINKNCLNGRWEIGDGSSFDIIAVLCSSENRLVRFLYRGWNGEIFGKEFVMQRIR